MIDAYSNDSEFLCTIVQLRPVGSFPYEDQPKNGAADQNVALNQMKANIKFLALFFKLPTTRMKKFIKFLKMLNSYFHYRNP